jgi:hypothetical protein
VSKTQYSARLAALQRMTGHHRLEDVLLQGVTYKTVRHLCAYKVVLSPTLHEAIVASLHQQPRLYLFEPPTAPGHPFLDYTFNHWARRSFQAVFGRPLTSNNIRHAYANTLDLNSMTHDQLQAAARRMSHVGRDLEQTAWDGSM